MCDTEVQLCDERLIGFDIRKRTSETGIFVTYFVSGDATKRLAQLGRRRLVFRNLNL